MKKNKNICLVGVGAHSKRIYLNYFKKHNLNLALVLDIDSQKDNVRKLLDDNGFYNTKIYTIKDKVKDNKSLDDNTQNVLKEICNLLEITHIIIATEPKAHYMYLEFALKNDIHVLTDKPITVTKNMTSKKSIEEVKNRYYELLELSKKSKGDVMVMCQRQYHYGYELIRKTLNEVVSKYKIPITFIDIYYCDGAWEMPHDLEKENHPYKYGYGELFHSGYHFIDLLSEFIKINRTLPKNKLITKGELNANYFIPNDELGVINLEDYKRIFKGQKIPDYYYNTKNPSFKNYGEKNFYGSIKLTNEKNQLITMANLNLLHTGFSRRGWIETRDFYKTNGRIRHERLNIQIGNLMNIQVHSYQSKQIQDRTDIESEELVGGLEHFDIDIFRNSDVIGGKPFERITVGSLHSEEEKKSMLGYNEQAREEYLSKFLNNKCDKGLLKDQAMAVEILYSATLGLRNKYKNRNKSIPINISNKYSYDISIKSLKKYSKKNVRNKNKELISSHEFIREYRYNTFKNYLVDENKVEVFLSIGDGKEIASLLLYKDFSNFFFADIYFLYIKILVKLKSIHSISKTITHRNPVI